MTLAMDERLADTARPNGSPIVDDAGATGWAESLVDALPAIFPPATFQPAGT